MIWESEFQESERNFDALRRRNLSTASRLRLNRGIVQPFQRCLGTTNDHKESPILGNNKSERQHFTALNRRENSEIVIAVLNRPWDRAGDGGHGVYILRIGLVDEFAALDRIVYNEIRR